MTSSANKRSVMTLFSNKTDMVIRKTQNLEKMYRTGFFADVKN